MVGYIAFLTAILAVLTHLHTWHTSLPAHACALLDSSAYFPMRSSGGCAYSGHAVTAGGFVAHLVNEIFSNAGTVITTSKHGG